MAHSNEDDMTILIQQIKVLYDKITTSFLSLNGGNIKGDVVIEQHADDADSRLRIIGTDSDVIIRNGNIIVRTINGNIPVTSDDIPTKISELDDDTTVSVRELTAANITGGTLKVYTVGHNVQIVADALVLSDTSAISSGITPVIPTASGTLNSFGGNGSEFMWTSADGTIFFNVVPGVQYWGTISTFI